MKYAIGIDLGTCNSAVTHLNSSGNSDIIVNDLGEALTPSVVNFTRSNLKEEKYVGTPALRVLFDEPENTCARFKRHMGTKKTWQIFGTEYDPTILSAFVLEKLIVDALDELRRSDPDAEIAHAVVTVPAEFSKPARLATVEAAEAAGIKEVHLLDEPTAAVLYHQHCRQGVSDLNGIYSVVDLGGGTFDISIVRVERERFWVLCSTGSVELGGVDFDRRLLTLVREKFARETDGCMLDDELYTEKNAEEWKKILTDKQAHRLRLSGKCPAHDKPVRRQISITREGFEASIQELIDLIGKKCTEAMEKCSISPIDIREVILVGGSGRVPAVKAKIDEVFETNSSRSKDCDEAVARGAGVFAASSSMKSAEIPFNEHQRNAIGNIIVTEVLHKHYGIVALDRSGNKEITFILDRGTQIPCDEEQEFFLTEKDTSSGRSVEWTIIESTEGDKDPMSRSSRIVQVEILDIPSDHVGHTSGKERQLIAKFRCDLNKLLHCEFVDTLTGACSKSRPILLDEGGETA